MTVRHDLVVVGGGPAGYAAAAGLDIGLVEDRSLGGTCLHVGRIQAKELLETTSVLCTVRDAAGFGVVKGGLEPTVDLAVNWEATVDEVAEFIQPHPTLSELLGETAMALTSRALHG